MAEHLLHQSSSRSDYVYHALVHSAERQDAAAVAEGRRFDRHPKHGDWPRIADSFSRRRTAKRLVRIGIHSANVRPGGGLHTGLLVDTIEKKEATSRSASCLRSQPRLLYDRKFFTRPRFVWLDLPYPALSCAGTGLQPVPDRSHHDLGRNSAA